MKKIIFIFLSLISISVYGQPCAGITSTGTVKSKTFKSCYDSVLVTSVLNTVIADTVTANKLTVTGTISASNLSGTNTGDQTTISGNAGTATALQTARNINGVSFNGTADITVTSSAVTLTGTTLNSSVVNSSLTSVGTLTNLTVTNPISGSVTGNAATVTTNANLTGAVTSSGNATSLGSFTSANLSGALTNETGTGVAVFSTSPSLVTPTIDAATGTSLTLNQNISSANWGVSGIKIMMPPRRLTNNTSSGIIANIYNNVYPGDTNVAVSSTTATNLVQNFFPAAATGANFIATNPYSIGTNGNILIDKPNGRLMFANSTGGSVVGNLDNNTFFIRTNNTNRINITGAGLIGIGSTPPTPTAYLHLAAGTTTANTAPLKLTSGTNLTTAESGAVEYDGTNFYITNSTPTRLTVDGSLRGSATLNFPSISPQSTQTLTITVTGAADGDIIAGLGVPSAANVTNVMFTAQVTSSNTVTVTAWNFDTVSARDPASATFKVAVIK